MRSFVIAQDDRMTGGLMGSGGDSIIQIATASLPRLELIVIPNESRLAG